jgi:hypothetical protein
LVLKKAAADVTAILKGRNLKSVSEPEVKAVGGPRGAGEEDVRRTFVAELKNNRIKVEVRGDARVRIEYEAAEVPDPAQPHDPKLRRAGTRFKVVVQQPGLDDRPPLLNRTYKAAGLDEMARGVALHGDFQAATVLQVEEKALAVARARPRTHIDGNAVLADKGSPFGVEVVVGAKARRPEDRGGAAFVNLRGGEVYTLRLVNRSRNEVAVRLTIDGLSLYHRAGAGQPRVSAVLVPPGSTVSVPGWFHTTSEVFQFKVGRYPVGDKARNEIKSELRQAITATFAAAWEKGKDPPPDEAGLTRGAEGFGTLVGDRIAAKSRAVEREVGVVRAAVTVRYDVAE